MKVIVSCPGAFWNPINSRQEQVPHGGTYCCGVHVPVGDNEMDLDDALVKRIQAEVDAKRTLVRVKVVEAKRK